MDSNSITGIFTIKSNEDGDWYELEFKPDHEQTWSARPTGFVVKAPEMDSLYHVGQIIGTGRSPELVRRGQRVWFISSSNFQEIVISRIRSSKDHREAPPLSSRWS
jgi:hypothetical protein